MRLAARQDSCKLEYLKQVTHSCSSMKCSARALAESWGWAGAGVWGSL